MQFRFDARQVEPSTGIEIWPAAWYKVRIVGSEQKAAQTGGGQRMVFEVECLEGPYAGKHNYIGLNISHSNPQTVERAYQQLSAICWVTGKFAIEHTQELHGIPFQAYAKPSERGNNWDQFKDMAGNDAVQLARGTAQPAAQQPGGFPQQPPAQSWGNQPPAQAPQPPAGSWQAPTPGSGPGSPPPPAAPQQPAWGGQAPQAPQAAPAWGAAPQAPQAPAQPAWGGAPQQPAQAPQQPAQWSPGGPAAPGAAPPWGAPR